MEGVAVRRQRWSIIGAARFLAHFTVRQGGRIRAGRWRQHLTCWRAQTGDPRENCEGAVGRTSGNDGVKEASAGGAGYQETTTRSLVPLEIPTANTVMIMGSGRVRVLE